MSLEANSSSAPVPATCDETVPSLSPEARAFVDHTLELMIGLSGARWGVWLQGAGESLGVVAVWGEPVTVLTLEACLEAMRTQRIVERPQFACVPVTGMGVCCLALREENVGPDARAALSAVAATAAWAYSARTSSPSQAALEHSISILDSALESTADGILIVDRDHRIVRSNGRFVEIWQIPPEIIATNDDDRAIQFVLDQLVDPEAFVRRVRELYAHPEKSSFDTLVFHDGRVIERYSQPHRLGDQIVGRVWSFRDVTTRVRAEEDRDRLLEHEKAARAAAEDAVRMRDEFLSIASHELRTPLTSLVLFAQALGERLELGQTVDREELQRTLELSGRQIRRLSALVGLLLDVSRVRHGGLTLKPERFDLYALVDDTCALLTDQAAHAGSTLTVSGTELEGTWDKLRVEQVVTNLVTNAIKFGRGRPIEVDVARDDGMARLTVTDHGIGIPMDIQAKLFEPFVRGVSSRHFGGLGLGLYITRAIVEEHGGEIAIESEPGRGTCFVVRLPLGAP